MVASTAGSNSLKFQDGKYEVEIPGKTTEACQVTIMLHSKDWRIQTRDC